MVSVFVFFLLPFIFLCFLDIFDYKGRAYKWFYFFSCVSILWFSLGIAEDSGDFVNYKESFENVDSWQEYITGSTLKGYAFEPGFLAIYLLIKQFITTDGNLAVILVGLFAGGGLLYFIPRYSRYAFIALVVYIAHFYWWLGVVLIRQMCAMVLLFPIISFIQEEKWKRSVILVALAALFHASALIFYVFLLMKWRKLFMNVQRIFILISLTFIIGYLNIFDKVVFFIADHIPRGNILKMYVMAGSDRSLNILAYIEMLLILFIALKYRLILRQVNRYTDIAIEYLIYSVLLGGLFFHYEIGTRFIMYFNFYSYLILLPAFIFIFKQNLSNRIFYVLGLCTYLMIFLIRFVYVTF